MSQPKFCDIINEAKAIALSEQAYELVRHIELAMPPLKDEAHRKRYGQIIDRAWIKLNVERDRA